MFSLLSNEKNSIFQNSMSRERWIFLKCQCIYIQRGKNELSQSCTLSSCFSFLYVSFFKYVTIIIYEFYSWEKQWMLFWKSQRKFSKVESIKRCSSRCARCLGSQYGVAPPCQGIRKGFAGPFRCSPAHIYPYAASDTYTKDRGHCLWTLPNWFGKHNKIP